jgi:hypothetical protein
VLADPEHCVASNGRTNPLTKNHLAMTIHVRPEAGLDNGGRSWQVRTVCCVVTCRRLPDWVSGPLKRPGHPMRSCLRRRTLSVAVLMIDG